MAKDKGANYEPNLERKLITSLYDWLGTLVIALSVFALLFAFAIRVVGVDGSSMLPTLQDGDRLLLSIAGDSYFRGDIVVVDRYTDEPLIKRVIAVGGDTLTIDAEGGVYINGSRQNETYILGDTLLRDFSGMVKIPQGYVFVMGDNRTVSKDSRSSEIGLVSTKDIVGKAVYCVWPLESIGSIE